MSRVRVHNTLTGRKEELITRQDGKVAIYLCGPTVYSNAHIGHLKPLIFMDVVVRYLEYIGYRVFYVQNFTDVDDRIIQRANEEGIPASSLAQRYIDEYMQISERLKVRKADVYPKVSEHIEDIIEMIQGLMGKGYAYQRDGDVFFDVEKFADYGKLSGRKTDEMLAGARIEVDPRKKSPLDFALWKSAKPGEPSWESPWGPGRPGWHIECSAMSLKYLGNGFDIHGGGNDLIFPHHENEIAQSEAFTGTPPFARYWLHNGMLQLDEEKMSKSLGNIVRATDVLDAYRPEVVRLFMLSVHYRSPQEYDRLKLEEARKAQEKLQNVVEALRHLLRESQPSPWAKPDVERNDQLVQASQEARQRFEAAMCDDFNTALALSALFDLARKTNSIINAVTEPAAIKEGAVKALQVFEELGGVLGILGELDAAVDDISADLISLLLEVREEARKNRNFHLADKIRDRLADLGIKVEDTPSGPRWKIARS